MRAEQRRHQLGIFSWFGYRMHMAERARIIKEAGFEVTSLWWGDEEKENTGSLHDLPGIVRDAGLVIDNIHVPFAGCNNLWSEDKAVRDDVVGRHLGWIEDCARHKVPIMVMHVSAGGDAPKPNRQGFEGIMGIVEAAEKAGVVLAVENVQRNEALNFIFSQIDSPHLSFCYDSSHDFLWGKRPTEILGRWGSRLVTTHFSDNDGQEDRHWIPDGGIVDWQKVADVFPKEKYAGHLMLEILPKDGQPNEAAEVFIARAYNSLSSVAKLFY